MRFCFLCGIIDFALNVDNRTIEMIGLRVEYNTSRKDKDGKQRASSINQV
jgi:hypothetical protein